MLNNLGLGFLFTAKDMASGAVQGINANIEQLAGNSERAQRVVETATQTMAKGLKLMGAGTAILGAVAAPVLISSKWEKGMAEVWTVADITKEKLTSMGDESLGIMVKYGEELGNTTTALYNTLSASVPVEQSMGFLDQAMKSSVAGVTDANTAVNGLSNVLNAYTNQSYTASQASDYIFTAVKRGKTTFGEMAASIGEVNSVANGLGLGFDQIAAGFATLTKGGNNTAKAATLMKAALIAAMSKQETAAKMGPKVRAAFSLDNLKAKGLQQWMVEVNDAVGGSQEKLVKLIGSSEGVSAFMSMTGKNAAIAAGDLDGMRTSAGATDEAFKKMSNTFDFRSKIASAATKGLMVQVGTGLRNALTPVIDIVGQYISKIGTWAKDNKDLVTTIMKVVAAFGAILFVVGLVLAIGGAVAVFTFVLPGILTGLATLGGALASIAWPVILIVGLIYLFYKAWDSNLGNIRGLVKSFVAGVVEVFNFLKNAVINIAVGIYDGFSEWIGPITEPLKDAFGTLFIVLGDLFTKIGGLWSGLGTDTEQGASKIMMFLKAMGNVVGQVLGGLVTVLSFLLAAVVHVVAFAINTFIVFGESIGTVMGMAVVGISDFINWLGGAWDSVVDTVSSVASAIGTAFVQAWTFIKGVFQNGVAFILSLIFTPWQAILKLAEKIPGLGGYAKEIRLGMDAAIQYVKGDESPSTTPKQSPLLAPSAVAASEGQKYMMTSIVEKSGGDTQAIREAADAMRKVSERPVHTTVVLDGEKVNSLLDNRRNLNNERAFSPAGA